MLKRFCLHGVFGLVTLVAILCAGMVGVAQVPLAPAGGARAGDKHLAFEVISIRRNTAANGPVQFGPTADGFHAINLPLFAIFQLAYAPSNESGVLRGDRIAGAADWMMSEHYDVVAKVEDADLADWQKPQQRPMMLHAMLQAMLADRCKVVVHHESKEMPVYDLVVAKGGPKFKQAEIVDVDELKRKYPSGGRITGGGLAVQGSNGTQFYGVSMAWLGQMVLSTAAGRPVVDKTGLDGGYDFLMPSAGLPPPPPGAFASAPSQPQGGLPVQPEEPESIFSLLPKALGLRLEAAKGAVEMLVIDHVERPTEN